MFRLIFFMMAMMSTGGLMIISQFASFSRDFGVTKFVLFGFAALPLALTIDRITNSLTRPFSAGYPTASAEKIRWPLRS